MSHTTNLNVYNYPGQASAGQNMGASQRRGRRSRHVTFDLGQAPTVPAPANYGSWDVGAFTIRGQRNGDWTVPSHAETNTFLSTVQQQSFTLPAAGASTLQRGHTPTTRQAGPGQVNGPTSPAPMSFPGQAQVYVSTLKTPGPTIDYSNGQPAAGSAIYANGNPHPLQLVPEVPTGNTQYYCKELDGTWQLRTTNDIMNNCQPGKWLAHHKTKFPYWVRGAS